MPDGAKGEEEEVEVDSADDGGEKVKRCFGAALSVVVAGSWSVAEQRRPAQQRVTTVTARRRVKAKPLRRKERRGGIAPIFGMASKQLLRSALSTTKE